MSVDEQWPPCIDCGEEEATCGERCRDCDIDWLLTCSECGERGLGGFSCLLTCSRREPRQRAFRESIAMFAAKPEVP